MNVLELRTRNPTKFKLPKGWPGAVKSAMLRAIALARYSLAEARGEACEGFSPCCPCHAENGRLLEENSLLREEMRIKDARMALIPPHRRPHYLSTQRMDILELRAARGWSLEKTARAMLVAPATISCWLRRIDEDGPDALVQLHEPVNKFPQLVGNLVRTLKKLCPMMGKAKIAQMLARSGLHLGATTVGRMLHQSPSNSTENGRGEGTAAKPTKPGVVTAKRPNHVWHVDLTVVPIGGDFWVPWPPLALPQCWPFCWWVAVVVDHFSRRVMGAATFAKQPSSADVRAFLGRTITKSKAAPKYLVCDQGRQFNNPGFRRWCRRNNIQPPRYGAIGKHGSIAVVERFIRTLKENLRRLALIPMMPGKFRQELSLAAAWYNEHRPHETLGGCTPNEVYFKRRPANRRPRYEPRSRWPRGSPCAKPWALVRGKAGAKLELEVTHYAGRKHLPIVTLRRAA